MTYAEVAARNAETIASVREYEMGEGVYLSAEEYAAMKTAALVFQIEHGDCGMEINDNIG